MIHSKKSVFDFIDNNREEMILLWKELVNTESGTQHKDDVDVLAQKIRSILQDDGFSCRNIEFEEAGNTLIAETDKDNSRNGILLLGHMDTVFPTGTVENWPFRMKHGKAFGPGVLDMKGGIVIMLYIIKALKEVGFNTRPIKVILSGDEDSGHARSDGGKCIQKEAEGLAYGFNFETGFINNAIAVSRKGGATYFIEVEGVGSHAGNAPEHGRSAILEMAHKILEIHKHSDLKSGSTLSVGTIQGGTVANAIPAHAKIEIDARFLDLEKAQKSHEMLHTIADTVYIEGTTSKITEGLFMPPMPPNEGSNSLFELVRKTAVEIGLSEPSPFTPGGGSDSSFAVLADVPVLCAMGVQGELNHTKNEYALVESLFDRTKLIAASILNHDLP